MAVAAESHYSSLTVSKRAAELGCGWTSTLSPCATRRKLPHTSADRRWNGSDTHVYVALWARGLGGSGLRCHTQIPPGELQKHCPGKEKQENAAETKSGWSQQWWFFNTLHAGLNIKQFTIICSDWLFAWMTSFFSYCANNVHDTVGKF